LEKFQVISRLISSNVTRFAFFQEKEQRLNQYETMSVFIDRHLITLFSCLAHP